MKIRSAVNYYGIPTVEGHCESCRQWSTQLVEDYTCGCGHSPSMSDVMCGPNELFGFNDGEWWYTDGDGQEVGPFDSGEDAVEHRYSTEEDTKKWEVTDE